MHPEKRGCLCAEAIAFLGVQINEQARTRRTRHSIKCNWKQRKTADSWNARLARPRLAEDCFISWSVASICIEGGTPTAGVCRTLVCRTDNQIRKFPTLSVSDPTARRVTGSRNGYLTPRTSTFNRLSMKCPNHFPVGTYQTVTMGNDGRTKSTYDVRIRLMWRTLQCASATEKISKSPFRSKKKNAESYVF